MIAAAFDHIGLTVEDLHGSLDFYCGLLGLRALAVVEDDSPETAAITGLAGARLRMADLVCPNGDIVELIEYAQPRGERLELRRYDIGTGHIAFAVTDIEVIHHRLTEAGFDTRSTPVRLRAPGSLWDGVSVFYAQDNDGRTIEFVQGRGHWTGEGGAPLVLGIDHPGLIVGDLNQGIAFYCNTLGLRLVDRVEDDSLDLRRITGFSDARLAIADLICDDGKLVELIQFLQPRRPAPCPARNAPGLVQVGFRVRDISEAYDRLQSPRIAGLIVPPHSPPVRIQAPGSIWDQAEAFYATDGDGRTVELIQWPEGSPTSGKLAHGVKL
jgi:catechol 2,3-dioxygenase-like lactoylglutathione lyase family enzyme